jgi:hypothetical protein
MNMCMYVRTYVCMDVCIFFTLFCNLGMRVNNYIINGGKIVYLNMVCVRYSIHVRA